MKLFSLTFILLHRLFNLLGQCRICGCYLCSPVMDELMCLGQLKGGYEELLTDPWFLVGIVLYAFDCSFMFELVSVEFYSYWNCMLDALKPSRFLPRFRS